MKAIQLHKVIHKELIKNNQMFYIKQKTKSKRDIYILNI